MSVKDSITTVTRGEDVYEVIVENSTEKQLTGMVLNDMDPNIRADVEKHVVEWQELGRPMPFTIYLARVESGIAVAPYMRTLPMTNAEVVGPVLKFQIAPLPKSVRRRKRKPVPEGFKIVDADASKDQHD